MSSLSAAMSGMRHRYSCSTCGKGFGYGLRAKAEALIHVLDEHGTGEVKEDA